MVTLASFPLGFRFRPTDEELVTHYLKGKINGCESQVEVIPEIDVCKCEPWDLPGKSIIQSDDPEWFFFAPRDRKYPNGHRSNRATEAGYWKATGKDRAIRRRTPSGNMLIGMKKTLVFYQGRAPKGDRTGWIMHEYRTVNNEVDGTLSDQGSYVLCRLFKKPLEKSANSTNEPEEVGFSPGVIKSSPDITHHVTPAEEHLDTAADQDVRGQDMQYDQSQLSHLVINQVMGDQINNVIVSPKSEDSYSNVTLAADSGVRSNIESQDGLTLDDIILCDPLHSPSLLNKRSSPNDVGEDCYVEDFLNSMLHDPDEYISPVEDPIIQKYSVSDCSTNQVDQIYNINLISSDPSWNEIVESNNEVDAGLQLPTEHVHSNINSQLLSSLDSWESILRYSQIGERKMANDACAGESGSFLGEGSFNVADSSTVKGIRDGGDDCARTGIQIRYRVPQNSPYANIDQGTATRRIRLHCSPQDVGFQSVNTLDRYSIDSESSSIADVSNAKVEFSQKYVLKAEKLDQPADAKNPVDSNKDESCDIAGGICSAQRATEITHFADEISLADEKPDFPDATIQSKSELRQRKQNDGAESLLKGRTPKLLGANAVSAFKHVTAGYVLLVLLVIMFMVLAKYL